MNAQIIFEKRQGGNGIYKFAVLDSGLSCGLGAEKEDQEIHIMIDTSGSMDELCSDKNTKLDQIKYVIRNMIRYILEHSQNCGVILSVSSFNQRVQSVISRVPIKHENMNELFGQIDKMYATDQTNIEIALNALRHDTIKEQDVTNGVNRNKHNIFMSDGEANMGITDPLKLVELVDINAFNTFIGFGLEHDPYMFSTLSATQNSKYYFIAEKEKAGIAYGEILHGILNNVWSNVLLVCHGCEVYDYKTDIWTNTLYIGRIAAFDVRTFHIRRVAGTAEESVKISLTTGDSIICDTMIEDKFEHMPEMEYRLKTLQMLYKASNFTKHHKEPLMSDIDDEQIEIEPQCGVKEIKGEMKALLREMMAFMETQTDIRFMKNLCDDIVVVLRTIDTSYGHMFSCSRQHSQGDERIHTTTLNDEINELSTSRMMPSRLTRQYTNQPINFPATVDLYSPNNMDTTLFQLEDHVYNTIDWGQSTYSLSPLDSPEDTEADGDIDDYVVSNEIDSPYCTDDKMFVIRNMSSTPDEK